MRKTFKVILCAFIFCDFFALKVEACFRDVLAQNLARESEQKSREKTTLRTDALTITIFYFLQFYRLEITTANSKLRFRK